MRNKLYLSTNEFSTRILLETLSRSPFEQAMKILKQIKNRFLGGGARTGQHVSFHLSVSEYFAEACPDRQPQCPDISVKNLLCPSSSLLGRTSCKQGLSGTRVHQAVQTYRGQDLFVTHIQWAVRTCRGHRLSVTFVQTLLEAVQICGKENRFFFFF